MRFSRSTPCFCATLLKALPVFGVVCVLLPRVSAQAQERLFRVVNDQYELRLVKAGDVALTIVPGIEAGPDEDAFPVRRVLVELPSADAVLSLRAADESEPLRALPFYRVGWKLSPDSVLTPEYRPAEPPARSVPPAVLVSRQFKRDGRLYAEAQVPLFSWDAGKSEARWIRAYTFAVSASDAPGPATVEERSGGYFTQPFILRSSDLDTSGTWIPASREGIKFHVREDGVYALTAEWLSKAGVSAASLDPARLSLVRKGREIPLLNVGTEDGRLDDGDALIFIGERNYDEKGYRRLPSHIDDPYPQYLNKYSDSAAYWLFIGGEPGRRIPVGAQPATPSDTIDWAFKLIHHEPEERLFAVSTDYVRQQVSDWGADKTWFETWMRTGTIHMTFMVDNLKEGKSSHVRQKSGSWAGNPSVRPHHKVLIGVNDGPALDSVEFDVNWQGLLHGRAPAGQLRNGENRIDITNVKLYEGDNALYLDWFDVEYPRRMIAGEERFDFKCDGEMGAGAVLFRVDSLAAENVIILRRRGADCAQLRQYSLSPSSPSTLHFADTLNPASSYFIVAADAVPQPPTGRLNRIPDLRSDAEQADYLVITAAGFLAEARQYASFIASRYGVATRAVNVEDIYDNYSFGVFNPEAVKVFLFDAYLKWARTPPRFVFLAGDANYNYKAAPTPHTTNYVPSFGFPVSDIWYVSFDPMSVSPSIAVGRLPAHSGADLLTYMDKHARMLALDPDPWDKTTLHFSGGTNDLPQESLDELKRMNDAIIQEAVRPPPYAGSPIHFYKTATPPTDFGPYPVSWVREKIEEGGIVISYIGHAAIRTWDNTIGDPSQLYNNSGRTPLVSDFGCSTSKFADPDGVAFAEQFVVPPGSQAIGYVGNAAIGFTTTAAVIGRLYYGALLRDGHTAIGEAHRVSKHEIARLFGTSVVNRVAIQSNVLIGDPIARLPVPKQPDPAIRIEWISPETEIITTAMDSAAFTLRIANLGTYVVDTLSMKIGSLADGKERASLTIKRPLPPFYDTIRVALPTFSESGAHVLRVELDPDNDISENSESNNIVEAPYNILSTHLLTANAAPGRVAGVWPDARVLHPMLSPGDVEGMEIQMDPSPDFTSPQTLQLPYGKTYTRVENLPRLLDGTLYYWRARLMRQGADYTAPLSFRSTGQRAAFVQRDSAEFARLESRNVLIDSAGVGIAPGVRTLRLISSGYNDGNYGTVELDGGNILPTTFGRGYYVAVLDSTTVELDTVAGFDTYMNPEMGAQFAAYLNSIPEGKIIAVVAMDDPFAYNSEMIPALRGIGSSQADSLLIYETAYRGSFAIIGRRGALPGTVPEGFRPQFLGRVTLDTAYAVSPDTAVIMSQRIGPAARWSAARIESVSGQYDGLNLRVYGISTDDETRLIGETAGSSATDLSSVDAALYPYIRLETALIPPQSGQKSPVLRSWSAAYTQRPELALNYQSVRLSHEAVMQGDFVGLTVGIANAGEHPADSFSVRVELTGADNIPRPAAEYRLPGLDVDAWHDTTLSLSTSALGGMYRVSVTADAGGEVPEQFENNNTFVGRLSVMRDTLPPVLEVLFDGGEPYQDDYIRPEPEVLLRLSDASPLPVADASNFIIIHNDTAVGTAGMQFRPMSEGKPAELTYLPSLQSGEHVFRFNAVDVSGNRALEHDRELRVLVDREERIVSLTNYPNPFETETAFLFTLTGTQRPEEATIKIYTVAGRLIRTISIQGERLRIGMNSCRWDGRDEDGDELANGVYFYKFLLRTLRGSTEMIGRIARLR